jgi:DNA polymerase (family 10)
MRLTPDGLADAGGALLATPSEEDVYEALGLATPPPELREDRGELDSAATNALPALIRLEDLRGDCHTHTRWSDGRDSLLEMIAAARER